MRVELRIFIFIFYIVKILRATMDIRLVDGGSNDTGRLEVYHDGRWGTVCDDNTDYRVAEVVCRQLGFESEDHVWYTKTVTSSRFGLGNGTVWLDELSCNGTERTVDECSHRPWGQNDCGHDEDLAIYCNVPKTPLRLVNGTNYNATAGRLEVKIDGAWGTVCDDEFGQTDAVLVCSLMKLPSSNAGVAYGFYFGPGPGPINLDDLKCKGDETDILQCSHFRHTDCTHNEDVGVICEESNSQTTVGRQSRNTHSTEVESVSFAARSVEPLSNMFQSKFTNDNALFTSSQQNELSTMSSTLNSTSTNASFDQETTKEATVSSPTMSRTLQTQTLKSQNTTRRPGESSTLQPSKGKTNTDRYKPTTSMKAPNPSATHGRTSKEVSVPLGTLAGIGSAVGILILALLIAVIVMARRRTFKRRRTVRKGTQFFSSAPNPYELDEFRSHEKNSQSNDGDQYDQIPADRSTAVRTKTKVKQTENKKQHIYEGNSQNIDDKHNYDKLKEEDGGSVRSISDTESRSQDHDHDYIDLVSSLERGITNAAYSDIKDDDYFILEKNEDNNSKYESPKSTLQRVCFHQESFENTYESYSEACLELRKTENSETEPFDNSKYVHDSNAENNSEIEILNQFDSPQYMEFEG